MALFSISQHIRQLIMLRSGPFSTLRPGPILTPHQSTIHHSSKTGINAHQHHDQSPPTTSSFLLPLRTFHYSHFSPLDSCPGPISEQYPLLELSKSELGRARPSFRFLCKNAKPTSNSFNSQIMVPNLVFTSELVPQTPSKSAVFVKS